MNRALYAKLARGNVKGNYRFFVPRMLAQSGLLAVFYIAITLATDGRLSDVPGGSYIPSFMWIGVAVLMLLSAILLLYTNGFLMKQRRSEFGVYSVLGMEKRHIGRVMFLESLISDSISIAFGLIVGILFYKLCSLLICRLLKTEIVIGFYFINPVSISLSVGFFVLLDLMTCLINRISAAKMTPLEMMKSRMTGEKEPVVKWFMLAAGIVSLGLGYAIALTSKNPLEALLMFFAAVILVIIGTYFLFVSGSVFVLKSLKRNKRFYYDKRHMPAVSGLLYRMKKNAVGLASIAILATGVLVMISTTVSLYSGYQSTLDKSYPMHLYLDAYYTDGNGSVKVMPGNELENIITSAASVNGLEIEKTEKCEYLLVSYALDGNNFYTNEDTETTDISQIVNVVFITADTCRSLGTDVPELDDDEMIMCRISSHSVIKTADANSTVNIHGKEYSVEGTLSVFPVNVNVMASAVDTYGVVLADREALDRVYQSQTEAYGKYSSDMTERVAVRFSDLDAAEQKSSELYEKILHDVNGFIDECSSDSVLYSFNYHSYWGAKESLLGMYGTLMFLGILLGTVCLFATALIIYYKQISEGYEDRERFRIMEKIGLSRTEVRKTINSQMRMVFFLPVAVAGIHLCFASPMLLAMLNILSLFSVKNYIICALSTFGVFTLVYILIYTATSRTYYRIVH